ARAGKAPAGARWLRASESSREPEWREARGVPSRSERPSRTSPEEIRAGADDRVPSTTSRRYEDEVRSKYPPRGSPFRPRRVGEGRGGRERRVGQVRFPCSRRGPLSVSRERKKPRASHVVRATPWRFGRSARRRRVHSSNLPLCEAPNRRWARSSEG